jgi:hypothetical protein
VKGSRRLGPAKGDRVNFAHHNLRAIVLPEGKARRRARKKRRDDVFPPQPQPQREPASTAWPEWALAPRPEAPPPPAPPPPPVPARSLADPFLPPPPMAAPLRGKVPRRGWWTCPGCRQTKCKFDKHMHHLVGHLTPRGLVCNWHRYLSDQPPPAGWPSPSLVVHGRRGPRDEPPDQPSGFDRIMFLLGIAFLAVMVTDPVRHRGSRPELWPARYPPSSTPS